MWAASLSDLYVIANNGKVLHSVDAGAHWTSAVHQSLSYLSRIWGVSTQRLFIVSDQGLLPLRDGQEDPWLLWNPGVHYRSVWETAGEIYLVGKAFPPAPSHLNIR